MVDQVELSGLEPLTSCMRAGAVSAHYLPSLGNEPRDAVSGDGHGF
jgi:hypothetical protein